MTTLTTDPAHTARQTEQTLLAYCRQQGLFAPHDRVIAACSGGADSMALLLFLVRCAGELGITVAAAHVNHGLRGAAAYADAAFVADFCARSGIEFFLLDARRAGVAIPPHPGEDWSRRLRYGYFDRLAAEQGARIATAHTLSDQAETLLLHLARGAGVQGAAGIRARRGPYRRPFLCLTRAQTEAYCAALGQSYVQDATNGGDLYARNRIRHAAVPALQSVNPAAEQALGRFCARMAGLDAWLAEQSAALLAAARTPGGYDLRTLRAAPAPVLERALQTLVAAQRDPGEAQIELLRAAVERGSGAVQLSAAGGYRDAAGRLAPFVPRAALPLPAPPCPFAAPGEYTLPGGYRLRAELLKYEEFLKNDSFFKKHSNCCADYARIQENIILRTRLPGDHFCPAGRGGGKTLKKLFNEAAVLPQERGLLPLLALGGEVLWLWGFGFAQGCAPGPGTATVLLLRTGRDAGGAIQNT